MVFPKPVGLTTSTECPLRAASTTGNWPSRKRSNPKRRRAGPKLRLASDILRLVDQATTRELRPTSPSHGEKVALQVLDDARHGARHIGLQGSTGHPFRQLIAEASDVHLRLRRGTNFHTQRIGGYRGKVPPAAPWSSSKNRYARVTQSSVMPNSLAKQSTFQPILDRLPKPVWEQTDTAKRDVARRARRIRQALQ